MRALRRALRGAPRVRGALLPAHAAGAAAEGRHLLHELILLGAPGRTGRAVGPAGVPAAAHPAPNRARARMLRNMMSPTVKPLPELASRRRWRPSIRRVACGLLGDRPTHTQTSRATSSARHDDIWTLRLERRSLPPREERSANIEPKGSTPWNQQRRTATHFPCLLYVSCHGQVYY